MVRIVVAGILLIGSVLNAAAETDIFKDVLQPNGHARSLTQKFADGRACGASADRMISAANFPAFKACMAARGWVLDHVSPSHVSRSKGARSPAEAASARAADEAARPWCYGAFCDEDDSACMDDPSNTFSICADAP